MSSKIRIGTKWLLVGKTSTRVMRFAIGIALARLLFPADFGMIVTIQIFTGVAGFFASGGLAQSLVRSKEMSTLDYQVVFTLQLIICSLICAFFFFWAPFFASWYGNPLYCDLMRLSCITFLIRPFNTTPSSLLQRDMRFKEITRISIISLILSGTTSITLAYLGYGPWSLIMGGLVGGLFSMLQLKRVTRWSIRLRLDRNIIKEHSGYGIQVSLNNLTQYIYNQAPNFIISRFMGSTEVGLFNKANSLAALPMDSIGSAPYATIFRSLAIEQDNQDKSQYLYLKSVALVLFYTLPFYVGLWWVADPLVTVLYGEKWADTVPILLILVTLGVFNCIGNPGGSVLEARRMVGYEVMAKLASLALLLTLIGLYYAQNLLGIAASVVASSAAFHTAVTVLAIRDLRISAKQFLKAIYAPISINVGLFVVLAIFNYLLTSQLGISISNNRVTYLGFMIFSGVFSYITMALLLNKEAIYSEPRKVMTKIVSYSKHVS